MSPKTEIITSKLSILRRSPNRLFRVLLVELLAHNRPDPPIKHLWIGSLTVKHDYSN